VNSSNPAGITTTTARGRAFISLIVFLIAGLAGIAGAQVDDLQAAQRRANRAAEELSKAEEAQAIAEDTVANLEARVARVEERVAAVRSEVAQLAVRQYVQGTFRITRLLRMADANDVVRAQQYASVVASTSTEALEQYRADKEDLRVEVAALTREQADRDTAIEDLRRRQADAVRELERLARLAEQARAAREEQERRAEAAAAAAAAATSTVAPRADGAPAPATTARPSAPTTVPAPAPTTGDWVCPVRGPHAFSNDYGAPRGGGSSHMGNDILAPKGTPVVANVGGVVTQRNGAVSGLAYFLAGDDGNRYFGAHLDSFGASGRVSIGTVIGTVGNTGDASGGPPHLHFEMHPGGSGYTNPYPTLTRYC
jgi:murein DD-endopeptidase MepM/ murein hydrolase activator NlpD